MHPIVHAVMLIQFGNTAAAKQRAVCIAYILSRGYRLKWIVEATGSPRDAVALVARGAAQVVVVAHGGRAIAAAVVAAGGRVEAVHPAPHIVDPPVPPPVGPRLRSVSALLARLRRSGKSVEQIAAFLDTTTGDIREMLRRGE